MAQTLRWLTLLFGLTCMAIALVHIAIGPSAIPGSVPVNATMDSEDRFYATLFLGFGALMMWCASDLRQRGQAFKFLLAVFFLGGISRLISIAQVGPPIPFFQIMLALELTMPLAMWWMHRRVFG